MCCHCKLHIMSAHSRQRHSNYLPGSASLALWCNAPFGCAACDWLMLDITTTALTKYSMYLDVCRGSYPGTAPSDSWRLCLLLSPTMSCHKPQIFVSSLWFCYQGTQSEGGFSSISMASHQIWVVSGSTVQFNDGVLLLLGCCCLPARPDTPCL